MPLFVSDNRVIVCLLMLVTFAFQLTGTSSALAQPLVQPVLNPAFIAVSPFGLVDVSGSGFTPDGIVRLSLVTADGDELDVSSTVKSSATVFGRNGSVDPAQGYVSGGTISFQFWQRALEPQRVNGSMDPAQPWVQSVEIVWPEAAIYGPNGSRDPAQGYVAQETTIVTCGDQIHYRALDVASATWSNVMAHTTSCGA
jgi:hypothetical protein